MSLDTKFFYAVYHLAGNSPFWDGVVFWANKISIPIFSLILLWYLVRYRKIFWAVAASVILSRVVLTSLFHWAYFRARPFVALPDVRALASQNPSESAFPSGHAAFFFAVAFTIYLYNRAAGVMLIVAALFLSLTRVYLGLHYPLDIAGGIAVAAIASGLVFWRLKQTHER